MLSDIDAYFHQQEEPTKGCLLFLRQHILHLQPGITESWKYSMPFYKYHDKRFCYLWVHKKRLQPYIGFVNGGKMNHPQLLQEKRVRMKIFLINPNEDIPINVVNELLHEAITLGDF